MVKKLKRAKKEGNYEDEARRAVEGVKPLGVPLPNRFLTLLIKNHIKNPDA